MPQPSISVVLFLSMRRSPATASSASVIVAGRKVTTQNSKTRINAHLSALNSAYHDMPKTPGLPHASRDGRRKTSTRTCRHQARYACRLRAKHSHSTSGPLPLDRQVWHLAKCRTAAPSIADFGATSHEVRRPARPPQDPRVTPLQ